MNLKYVAGKTGYMILEMRTKENIRRNSWDENANLIFNHAIQQTKYSALNKKMLVQEEFIT